jgi:hypothetical protein
VQIPTDVAEIQLEGFNMQFDVPSDMYDPVLHVVHTPTELAILQFGGFTIQLLFAVK